MLPKINNSHGSETRNIINAVIDSINVQGESIQGLVAKGQLTPAQYAELISIVNGNLKSGEIDIYDLSDSLRFELDKVNNKINRGNVSINDVSGTLKAMIDSIPNKIDKGKVTDQDIDKNNFAVDQTMISDSLRQMIVGDTPINAVPADGSITMIKLDANLGALIKDINDLLTSEYESWVV